MTERGYCNPTETSALADGYVFYDFFTQDSAKNKESLKKLKFGKVNPKRDDTMWRRSL
jgi:hypothetical protein